MVWRAARCLRSFDRLSSPASVILLHLIIRTNETSHSIVIGIVYQVKSRVMVWIVVRCLRPCDKLLSPLSVTLLHLLIRAVRRAIAVMIVYIVKSRVMI